MIALLDPPGLDPGDLIFHGIFEKDILELRGGLPSVAAVNLTDLRIVAEVEKDHDDTGNGNHGQAHHAEVFLHRQQLLPQKTQALSARDTDEEGAPKGTDDGFRRSFHDSTTLLFS